MRRPRKRAPFGTTYAGLIVLTVCGGLGLTLGLLMAWLPHRFEPAVSLVGPVLSGALAAVGFPYVGGGYSNWVIAVIGGSVGFLLAAIYGLVNKPADDRRLDRFLRARLEIDASRRSRMNDTRQ